MINGTNLDNKLNYQSKPFINRNLSDKILKNAILSPNPDKQNNKEPYIPQEYYYANYATRLSSTKKNISFQGNTANSINKANSITESGEAKLVKRPDGGYLVDKNTGTVIYYGIDAKNLLERTSYFDKETEIISQSDGSLSISVFENKLTTEKKSFLFSEPGAVLIEANTPAKIKVEKGNPLVITTERKPNWYEKAGPNGIHKEHFNNLIKNNYHIFNGHVYKTAFDKNDLKKLINKEILKTVDDNYVQFVNFDSSDTLKNKLAKLGFSGEQVEKISDTWVKTKERKLHGYENGVVKRDIFKKDTLEKLISSNILETPFQEEDNLFWKSYYTEEELIKKLNKAGILNTEQKDVVDVWKNTTRSGYDDSGLAWSADGVTVYLHKEKLNLWNQNPSDWIVSSDSWSKNKPFVAGVSRICPKDIYSKPTPFKTVRAEESLHSHPKKADKQQSEVYLITQGTAAILTMQNGKPKISVLNKGDMTVVNPGVAHSIMGIKGEYEHLVCQVPSVFQYGPMFKEPRKYEDYSITEEEAINMALKELNKPEQSDDSSDLNKTRNVA